MCLQEPDGVSILFVDTQTKAGQRLHFIFAILPDEGGPEQKKVIIRKIFTKLQQLFAGDAAIFLMKIKQLELLSLLRVKSIQQKISEVERNMPVTIDIREGLRFQQGFGEGGESIKTIQVDWPKQN